MAQIDEIAVKLGLKTADFKAALKAANVDVQAFKKAGTIGENEGMLASLRKITQRISQFRSLILGGGLVAAFRGLFSSAVTFAEQYTGAFDGGVAATLRMRNAIKELQLGIGQGAVDTIGFLEKVRLIYIAVTKGSDAFVTAVNKSSDASEKVFSTELVKKTTEAFETLAKVRLEGALSVASPEEKIRLLTEEQNRLLKEQEKVRGNIVEFLKQQAVIEKVIADIKKIKVDETDKKEKDQAEELARLRKKVDDAFEEVRKEEDKAAKDRKKQLKEEADAREVILKSYKSQLDAETDLATAQADRTKRTLADIAAGGGGTTATNKTKAKEILRLEREAARSRSGGFNESADRRLAAADALRKTLAPVLKSNEVDPLQSEREKVLEASRDYLKDIKAYLEPKEVDQ